VLPCLWVPVVEHDERLGVAIVSSGRGGGGGTVQDRREGSGAGDVKGMHRVSRGAAGRADGCGGSVGGKAGCTNMGGCAQEGFPLRGGLIEMSSTYHCWSVGLSSRIEMASSSLHDSQTTGH